MDRYLNDVRGQLKLAEITLKVRLVKAEQKPVGIISRLNEIAHTQAMLAAVRHARFISEANQDGWWEEPVADPF